MLMFNFTTRNTIGFKYWHVRFLCQCCFFLLVLVTVLIQAYNNALQSSEAIYIAIISCSTVFLYLEFIQGSGVGLATSSMYLQPSLCVLLSSTLHIIKMMYLLIATFYE